MKRRLHKFVKELVKTNFNQTEAYVRTFPNAQRDTARARAPKLMKREDVQEALKKAVEEITPEFVINELKSIALDCKVRPADRIRAWEVAGKTRVLDLFRPESQSNQLNLISDQSINDIKAKLSTNKGTKEAQKALPPSDKSLDHNALQDDSAMIDHQSDTDSIGGEGSGAVPAPTHP